MTLTQAHTSSMNKAYYRIVSKEKTCLKIYRWFLKRMTVIVRFHCISVGLFGLAQSHLDCLCFSVSFLFSCFTTWFWSRHVFQHVTSDYSLLLVAMLTVVTRVIVVALGSLISLLAKIQSNFYLLIYKGINYLKYLYVWQVLISENFLNWYSKEMQFIILYLHQIKLSKGNS